MSARDLLLRVLFLADEVGERWIAHGRARAARGQRALNVAPARRLGQAERLGREPRLVLGIARGLMERRQQADIGFEDVAETQIAHRPGHFLPGRLPRPRQQDGDAFGE